MHFTSIRIMSRRFVGDRAKYYCVRKARAKGREEEGKRRFVSEREKRIRVNTNAISVFRIKERGRYYRRAESLTRFIVCLIKRRQTRRGRMKNATFEPAFLSALLSLLPPSINRSRYRSVTFKLYVRQDVVYLQIVSKHSSKNFTARKSERLVFAQFKRFKVEMQQKK